MGGTPQGSRPAKIHRVPRWRDSDSYTPLEWLVLEYAEGMTATPPAVPDELLAALRIHLDVAQLVELTEVIAVENWRSRVNAALWPREPGLQGGVRGGAVAAGCRDQR